MPSLIAWLDSDTDEQSRMREIIRLFTDHESRDELGLGQVRDAISNGLFPGTSVLLTRARYFLFVPWCLMSAQQHRDPLRQAEHHERLLIDAMRRSPSEDVRAADITGLLGAVSGVRLQTLPSDIYWNGMRTFGILDETVRAKSDAVQKPVFFDDDPDLPAVRPTGSWHPGIPAVPEDFPQQLHGGFAMTHAESSWLRERILDRAAGTLLAHLTVDPPLATSTAPWLDPAAKRATGEAAQLLRDAEAFSTGIHGAQLLYNLLLAEHYEAQIPPERRRHRGLIESYRTRLTEWADLAEATRATDWNVSDFWAWTLGQSSREIAMGARHFVDNWFDVLRTAPLGTISDNPEARKLIHERERRQKGAQARLDNAKRIEAWAGASAADALVFRWPNVRRIVLDIAEGMARDA